MLNKQTIISLVERQQFYPTWLGIFVNPFYFARKGLLENIQDLAPNIKGKTLDIGCGSKPYEKIFQASEYIGLEIDSPENRKGKKADYFYQGDIFPFPDDSFDSIVTNEVFEHIFNPENFLSEIHRVLKQDGILLMTVPFVWDEHEQPYDYARYSSFGIKFLLEKHGFKIIEHRKSMNDIRTIFQLTNAYLYKVTSPKTWSSNLLVSLFLMSPFNILGEIFSKILPRNDDLYLDNIILAIKIKPS
jgi:SAM-dependent methyltransferase